jgi:4-diphosphocytidyl-2-C-methyl-D-erythritol kinase
MCAVPIVDAPAKLTRTLRITGVRDDGYHLIDAEMVTLELCDRLTINHRTRGLSADGPFAVGMPLDDSNLVAKALRLSGCSASVHIDKQIPHGGGLGGGSADAAAVLRWAGFDDLAAASRLGADIPFCLIGGRARVRGIGDIVEPLPFVDIAFTLIVPPLSVSTPAVYRSWDQMTGQASGGANDLELAAIAAVPELGKWRDRIAEVIGSAPTLAGSGATWFVEGHHERARELEPDVTVVFTRTRP